MPLVTSLLVYNYGYLLDKNEIIKLILHNQFFFGLFLSWFIFYEIFINNSVILIKLSPWIVVDNLIIHWSFLFDSITSVMIVIIHTISFFVQLYSFQYMKEDPHLKRFLLYLTLFTFFMLILVSSNTVVQMFIGWEGVGLASYLLINFWYTRYEANKSALKAVIINKIGDIGIYLMIIGIYKGIKSVNYSIIFLFAYKLMSIYINILGISLSILSFITFFLLIGAMAKSAQVGLHTWLPDAMEGPTPVSALLHAATMVTAGVFLIIRCSPLIEYNPWILSLLLIIGGITCFFSATIGLFQNDLKKVIAYSTCSQLGYMVFICGMSNYSLALFHLFNHAFFKALLFLSAGCIIHAMGDEQDMRKYGGLLKIMPFTYSTFFIGSLSLMGFPFLSGFYSKDLILEIVSCAVNFDGILAYWLGLFSAFLTAFYSTRLIFLTFYSLPNSSISVYKKVHEPEGGMFYSLFFLTLFSIFIGYIMKDLFIGFGVYTWENAIFQDTKKIFVLNSEYMLTFFKFLPFIFSIFGVLFSLIFYWFFNKYFFYYINSFKNIYWFFNKKWYFDNIYNNISDFLMYLSYHFFFKLLDRGILELIGPLGVVLLINKIKKILFKIHTGYYYHYILIIFFILVILFFILLTNYNLFYFFIFLFYFFI